MLNDSGLLSIDFLAGFTIFMIAFIISVTMVSGYFVGLESYKIDYNGVAYRTGVILVEDPGYTTAGQTAWETNDKDHTGNILRLGLAYSDDPLGFSRNNPNILSSIKVNKFFDKTYFPTPADYQNRLIFGDRPYNFNISLRSLDGPPYSYNNYTTDSTPQDYGYIRRVVKIREPGITQVDAYTFNTSTADGPSTLSIPLNFSALYSKNAPYMIDPLQEPVVINITNFSGIGPSNLRSVELFQNGITSPKQLLVSIDSSNNLMANGSVTDSILLILKPDPDFRTASESSSFIINYTFDSPQNGLSGTVYNFSSGYESQWPWPQFIPAVLEVKIW